MADTHSENVNVEKMFNVKTASNCLCLRLYDEIRCERQWYAS